MGGDESEFMIPRLDFSIDGLGKLGLKEGSEEWKKMSKRVREACENHGCFLIVCDDEMIPKGLSEEMINCIKELFDLPEETKMKHTSTKPYRSYTSDCPVIPLSQSFGIDDAHLFDASKAFTNLMWPQGNPNFCETMNSTSSKLLELSNFIMRMILEGYDLPKHYNSDIEGMNSTTNFRVMKYKAPKKSKDTESGLVPHTDKNAITILCQNDVHGLEVQTKTGKWVQLKIPQDAYVVIVGDILKAWSNGRLHAVTHRVMMSGDKERYSFGLFTVPKDEVKIKVPPELVDDKMHQLRYKSFSYGDYMEYFVSNLNENALDAFAGV